MSRELPRDVEASSKIARIGAVFGQHREVFLELVQVQGRKVAVIGLRDFGGRQWRLRLFRFLSGLLAS